MLQGRGLVYASPPASFEQLGQSLFLRQGRSLRLTEAGREALASAVAVYARPDHPTWFVFGGTDEHAQTITLPQGFAQQQ